MGATTMHREELRAYLDGLLEAARFRVHKPLGAYYVMTEIDALGWDDDVAFVRHLVDPRPLIQKLSKAA
jgi:aspartate/methionine/tyrosine aminotransferase